MAKIRRRRRTDDKEVNGTAETGGNGFASGFLRHQWFVSWLTGWCAIEGGGSGKHFFHSTFLSSLGFRALCRQGSPSRRRWALLKLKGKALHAERGKYSAGTKKKTASCKKDQKRRFWRLLFSLLHQQRRPSSGTEMTPCQEGGQAANVGNYSLIATAAEAAVWCSLRSCARVRQFLSWFCFCLCCTNSGGLLNPRYAHTVRCGSRQCQKALGTKAIFSPSLINRIMG